MRSSYIEVIGSRSRSRLQE